MSAVLLTEADVWTAIHEYVERRKLLTVGTAYRGELRTWSGGERPKGFEIALVPDPTTQENS